MFQWLKPKANSVVVPEASSRGGQRLPVDQFMLALILAASKQTELRTASQDILTQLTGWSGYTRAFILQLDNQQSKPLVALGFNGSLFEDVHENLVSRGLIHPLFQLSQPAIYLESDAGFGRALTTTLSATAILIQPIQAANLNLIVGLCQLPEQPGFDTQLRQALTSLSAYFAQFFGQMIRLDSLVVQNENLKQADEAKTLFLSIASHQLKTPLSAFNFASNLLKNPNYGQLNSKQLELVGEIERNTRRLNNLVSSLLSISRLEQGRLQPKPAKINLLALLNQILNEQYPKIQAQSLQVEFEVPPIIELVADPMLLHEALTNLVTNAIKYNRPRGRISLLASNNGHQVTIEVRDTGIGISQAEIAKLFSQFYRTESAQKIDPDGVGLGLYTAQQFVRVMGGELMVNSLPNKGSTFTIILPEVAT
ncbi:MAG: multi-sensor signal transduction histidine kinase [Candidatus Berkelbacteria bacterium Gr01-1014_85]|uniref:histidine kinase n=1 Tax=Candidatus Berkelbacteria bacterium Gr01-1014_85 TaxID=2017150 RepID=A0A554JBQ0_9BACT|nr:MAG: multi-sensor signal transduction histidine kinase [Candidatus Berkelbacteria bacterium Gr01-1014_85]